MRLVAATFVSRYKVNFNSFFIEVDHLLPVMLVNIFCHTISNFYRLSASVLDWKEYVASASIS